MDKQPLKELWDQIEQQDVWAVLCCSSGQRWSNQVAGTMCHQAEVEGFAFRLDGIKEPDRDPLHDRYMAPIDLALEWLRRTGLDGVFTPRGDVFHEAWIPVETAQGAWLVLTYMNSD